MTEAAGAADASHRRSAARHREAALAGAKPDRQGRRLPGADLDPEVDRRAEVRPRATRSASAASTGSGWGPSPSCSPSLPCSTRSSGSASWRRGCARPSSPSVAAPLLERELTSAPDASRAVTDPRRPAAVFAPEPDASLPSATPRRWPHALSDAAPPSAPTEPGSPAFARNGAVQGSAPGSTDDWDDRTLAPTEQGTLAGDPLVLGAVGGVAGAYFQVWLPAQEEQLRRDAEQARIAAARAQSERHRPSASRRPVRSWWPRWPGPTQAPRSIPGTPPPHRRPGGRSDRRERRPAPRAVGGHRRSTARGLRGVDGPGRPRAGTRARPGRPGRLRAGEQGRTLPAGGVRRSGPRRCSPWGIPGAPSRRSARRWGSIPVFGGRVLAGRGLPPRRAAAGGQGAHTVVIWGCTRRARRRRRRERP